MDAGRMDRRMVRRVLAKTGGNLAYADGSRIWASLERVPGSTIFSAVGLAAATARIKVRETEVYPGDIWRYGGQDYYITAWESLPGRQYIQITAAMVTVVTCSYVQESFSSLGSNNRPVKAVTAAVTFPGILTEKYLGYDRERSKADATVTYVLVTPAEVALEPGGLVTVTEGTGKGTYEVQLCHTLDPAKNEYEMTRKADV